MAAILVLAGCGCRRAVSADADAVDRAFLLIDPGHGGEDGGTVAEDGTLEKDINLAVGQDLRDYFTLWGIPVEMTRDDDVSIHDPGNRTARQKKVSDMVNRLERYQRASLVIAVHQNHFSVPKYAGAQVFYSVNHPDSRLLADAVQRVIRADLQPTNHREIKPATDSIYLLHRTDRPAILVECGFLSNPDERERLKTPEWQSKVACAICCGYWNYTMTEEAKEYGF